MVEYIQDPVHHRLYVRSVLRAGTDCRSAFPQTHITPVRLGALSCTGGTDINRGTPSLFLPRNAVFVIIVVLIVVMLMSLELWSDGQVALVVLGSVSIL